MLMTHTSILSFSPIVLMSTRSQSMDGSKLLKPEYWRDSRP